MITIMKTARLKADRVDAYRRLHEHIPERIVTNLRQQGIVDLRIHRHTAMIVMVIRVEESLAGQFDFDAAAEAAWQSEIGECFEMEWEDMAPVYTFSGEGEREDCRDDD